MPRRRTFSSASPLGKRRKTSRQGCRPSRKTPPASPSAKPAPPQGGNTGILRGAWGVATRSARSVARSCRPMPTETLSAWPVRPLSSSRLRRKARQACKASSRTARAWREDARVRRACRQDRRQSAEHRPWRQAAARMRAMPWRVRGPVDAPPCMRQRPLAIAGARQAVLRRVQAPQRGAFAGLPGGLPFFSQFPRGAWGVVPEFVISGS